MSSRRVRDVTVRSGDLRVGAVLVTPVDERDLLRGARRRRLATVTEWRLVPAGEPCDMDLFNDDGRCLRCGTQRPAEGTAHPMPEMVAYTMELGPGWVRMHPPMGYIGPPDAPVLVTAGTARRLRP